MAPQLTARAIDGRLVQLPSGRPTAVFFFAGWCGSCVPEAAALGQLQTRTSLLVVLTVAVVLAIAAAAALRSVRIPRRSDSGVREQPGPGVQLLVEQHVVATDDAAATAEWRAGQVGHGQHDPAWLPVSAHAQQLVGIDERNSPAAMRSASLIVR
jgi:thiol-disulfide isomerase/thioredoxin